MAKYSMIITFEGLFSEKIQEMLLWGYKYIILKRFSDRYNEFILKFYKNIKKIYGLIEVE